MVRERIERNRRPKDSRSTDNGKGDEEDDPHEFSQPDTADLLSHVGDGVAACVRVAKVSLHDCAVGVEGLPADHVDGTREGAEDEHG